MNEDFINKFAKIVKDKRVKSKMTQQQLSEKSSLSRDYISLIENSKVDFSISTAIKLADAFEIPLYEMINFNKNNPINIDVRKKYAKINNHFNDDEIENA